MPSARSSSAAFPASPSSSPAPDRFSAAAPERVTTLGRLSRERLAEIYRACDALIVPARGEGFPLSAQEALASGLPALIADDPGYAPNLTGVGSGARVVEAGGFAAALTELLEDPASLSEARRAAAEHARSAFTSARAADLHETLYERLLAQGGSAPVALDPVPALPQRCAVVRRRDGRQAEVAPLGSPQLERADFVGMRRRCPDRGSPP